LDAELIIILEVFELFFILKNLNEEKKCLLCNTDIVDKNLEKFFSLFFYLMGKKINKKFF